MHKINNRRSVPDFSPQQPKSEFLHIHKFAVIAVELHQFVMSATLHYAPFMQHAYHVGVGNSREAVSYDQSRAVLHQGIKSRLNKLLALAGAGRGRPGEN